MNDSFFTPALGFREEILTINGRRRRASIKQAHFFHHGQYLAVEVVCVHSFANWEQLVNIIRNPRGPPIDTLKTLFFGAAFELGRHEFCIYRGFS